MSRPSYKTCTEVTELCPVAATTYGYYPNLGVDIFFAAFFGVFLILQLFLVIRTKTWTFSLALSTGTLLECLGYIGRVLMNQNPWNSAAFQMQIVSLILGPSFVAAAIYLTLKHLVKVFGEQHSRLKARLYPWIFVGCDLGSIVLQAIGGGIASAAGPSDNKQLLDAGNGMMVAGIAFQVATMSGCGVLILDYVVSFRKSQILDRQRKGEQDVSQSEPIDARLDRHVPLFCTSVAVAYVTVLVRCIYRLPEMAGGWGNPLMRREIEFLILDGVMVALAVCALSLIHPGIFFAPMRLASIARKTAGSSRFQMA